MNSTTARDGDSPDTAGTGNTIGASTAGEGRAGGSAGSGGTGSASTAGGSTASAGSADLWGGVRGRVLHLRVALRVAGLLAVLGAVVTALVMALGNDGGASWLAGAIGFVAGVVLVAASYTASTLAIAWADSVNPRMVFPVGMAMYVTKFSLLGSLLIFVGGSTWAGKIPMAMGIVVGVVGWTATQIWWTVKTAHPYVGHAGAWTARQRTGPDQQTDDSPRTGPDQQTDDSPRTDAGQQFDGTRAAPGGAA